MRYHNITTCDMVNGEGLRTVLWVAGCEHKCEGCQNPCTWNPESGILFNEDAEKELFAYLADKYIEGITFSGGDPLHPNNRDEIGRLVTKAANFYSNKNIWLYTGYEWEKVLNLNLPWLHLVDVIVDGKFELANRKVDIKWRGSTNQRVINVKDSIASNKVVLWCD